VVGGCGGRLGVISRTAGFTTVANRVAGRGQASGLLRTQSLCGSAFTGGRESFACDHRAIFIGQHEDTIHHISLRQYPLLYCLVIAVLPPHRLALQSMRAVTLCPGIE
jgi:hypothetical protein